MTKMYLGLIGLFFAALSVFSSCTPYYYKFDKYINYLDKDSTYKSAAEKVRFQELKTHFLNIWLDSTNCLLRKNLGKFETDPSVFGLMNVKEVLVDNILHSPKFDTLAVLVTWYAEWYSVLGKDSAINRRTESKVICYIVDENQKWHIQCNIGTYTDLRTSRAIKELSTDYRKEILTWRYFKRNKSVDPSFFRRLFTLEDKVHVKPPIIWFFFHSLFHRPCKDELPLK